MTMALSPVTTASTPAPTSDFHAPTTASPAAEPVHEMDTTMEDADDGVDVHTHAHAAPSTPTKTPAGDVLNNNSNANDDDVFAFNAPSFYDLRRPEMEKHYVNNADGYFIQHEAAPSSTWSSTSSPHTIHSPSPTIAPDAALYASPPPAPAPSTPERPARPDLAARTPQTPFGGYREPQREQPDEDVDEMEEVHPEEEDEASLTMDLDALEAPREDDCMSDTTLVLETSMEMPTVPTSLRPPPRSVRSQASSASSSGSGSSRLLRPTQSYLRRIEAEQAARDRHLADQVAAATSREPVSSSSSSSSRSSRLTQPRSPRLRTSRKAHQRHATEIRLSSTSRELQKIKEEKMRVQLETMKIREFHARVRAQRPPANVHQRSTKQLTIPQSPFLAVGHRSSERRLAAAQSNNDEGRRPHPYIQPEQLLSRDFELPVASSHHSHNPHETTVPHSPQLQTAERAARRTVFMEAPETPPPAPDYSKMRVNGVTRALTPQFETDRRAQMAAAYRKPIDVVDKDEEELQRKFHARPINKKIFEAPSKIKSPVKKMPLTTPVTPGGRLGQPTASYEAAAAEAERLRRELEQQQQHEERQAAANAEPRRPVVPETPPLRSIYRHQLYQENLRRRQQEEEAELRKQREFRAQPIRLISTPPKGGNPDGTKRPLTEVVPFALHTDRVHERAQERLERLKREEEERLRAAAQFKARPMPSMDETDDGAVMAHHVAPPRAPARPLTKPHQPLLATDRRAAERAAFEAAERERRARDEAQRKQAEDERRRQEEEEIKRLRREQLVFHARPAPGTSKPFELKPTTRALTQPESPFLATKARSTNVHSSSAA
ncbi:hypothetical protein PINS_up008505 [Pythium insidiosum]|nr:hypothetical protein PINS_up008505 [Pythium insidiosum]